MAKKFVINLIKDKTRIASIIYDNGGYYDEAVKYLTELSNVVLNAEYEKADPLASIYRHLVETGGGMRNTVMDKSEFNKLLPEETFKRGDIKFGLMTLCRGGLDSYDNCESYSEIDLDAHGVQHNVLPDERQAQLMEEDDVDPFHFTCETAQTMYEYVQNVYRD